MTGMRNRRWDELNTTQKSGIVMLAIVQIALLVTALIDIRRRPPDKINGSKRLWTAAAFINFIGPIAYFAFGRKRST
ncbi:MAG TPA: PLD nuclease N-terminal domain-containing protein [Herpetosiphonaceae bacterium]